MTAKQAAELFAGSWMALMLAGSYALWRWDCRRGGRK